MSNKQIVMKQTMVIHARSKEWYGDDNFDTGRYKYTDDCDFLLTLNTTSHNPEAVRAAFNEMYDQIGMQTRYEYISMNPYIEPLQIKDIGGMHNLINKYLHLR